MKQVLHKRGRTNIVLDGSFDEFRLNVGIFPKQSEEGIFRFWNRISFKGMDIFFPVGPVTDDGPHTDRKPVTQAAEPPFLGALIDLWPSAKGFIQIFALESIIRC